MCVKFFEGARLLNPNFLGGKQIDLLSQEIDYLVKIPALQNRKWDLIRELPDYQVACDGYSSSDRDFASGFLGQTTCNSSLFL